MIDGEVGEQQTLSESMEGNNNASKDKNSIVNDKAVLTSATYALKRLKRDHPELAKQVINGDLSANAAAIQAGFRTKTINSLFIKRTRFVYEQNNTQLAGQHHLEKHAPKQGGLRGV